MMNQVKEVRTDNKMELINVLKACLNILRYNEGLTGEKALRNMSYLLILILLEPHFGGEIEIDIDKVEEHNGRERPSYSALKELCDWYLTIENYALFPSKITYVEITITKV